MLKYADNMQLYPFNMQINANNMQEIYKIIQSVLVEYAKNMQENIQENMQFYMQDMHKSKARYA